jgi:hypothetical protein
MEKAEVHQPIKVVTKPISSWMLQTMRPFLHGKEFGKRLNQNREQILVKTSPCVSPREF